MNNMVANNMSELWFKLYKDLIDNGEQVDSRVGATKHITDYTFCLEDPTQCVVYSSIRRLSWKYMLAELIWYFSGDNSVEFIGKYAKMWNSLTDDGKTVNSAYGYRIMKQFGFNQLEFVIDKLKKNPHDRQAVIHIKDPSNKPTKDTPCTCLLQFTVMHGKLNCHTYMRSNDIWFGTPYDVIFFTLLQQIVSLETGIPLGKYYHTIGDFHVYLKDIKDNVTEETIRSGAPFILDKSYSTLYSLRSYLIDGINEETLPQCIEDMRRIINERR